jgi:serine/threonine protein kinase
MRYIDGNVILCSNKYNNYISLFNEDYYLLPLNDRYKTSRGASSNLFILSDPTGDTEDKVIKICRSPLSYGRNGRTNRFKREIKAFKTVSRKKLRSIIKYYKDGEVNIDGEDFYFIIMEKADSDLSTYLETHKFDFTPNQKLTFCVNILNGIKQLHSAGIYHRDIKHNNILVVNGEFKIGDLGLVKFRHEDNRVDWVNEKIGPIGWLCPEATNKMLTNNKKLLYTYDCDIDESSDIFQLGKLFWYVFQGNLPLGQLLLEDFELAENDIYQIIFSMLQYQKARRPSIGHLETMLEPIKIKYGV